MNNKNLYEILGLDSDSTKEEIKIAYRKLVRIYHPDVNKTKEAENYFKLLNNAAETLLDDTKRLQYDTLAGVLRNKKDYVEKGASSKEETLRNAEENFNDIIAKTVPEKEFCTRPLKIKVFSIVTILKTGIKKNLTCMQTPKASRRARK